MNPDENKPEATSQPKPTPVTPASPVLNTSESQPPTPPPTVTSPTISSSVPKKRSFKKYLIALVVIIAFAAAIWAAVQITNKNSSSTKVTKHDIADLRFGTTEPIVTSNGFYPNIQGDSLSQEINIQAFEGLTKFVNNTQIAPSLATSWTNPNNTTWVFQIRQGVKFHDGTALTSRQVVASLTQIKDYNIGQVIPYNIKTVTAQSPYTVQITTTQPDPLLTRELTQYWIWDTDSKVKNSTINGTGPYVIKPGTKLTASSVSFVASNDYYGARPNVRQVEFLAYDTAQSLIAAMQQNKVDVADLTNQNGYAGQASKAGFKILNVLNPLVYYIVPNTLQPGSPLQNPKVRQALYLSIDPLLLAKAHNGDVGVPADQLVAPQIPGYNPNIKRPALDTTMAKALLAQAGYPNGFTVKFTYFSPQTGVAQELQKELAVIGVKLTLDPVTDGSLIFQKVSSGDVQLYVVGDSSIVIDTSDVANNFVIDTAEYKNAQVDSLYNQAQQTFNQSARLKLLQQLNAVVMNDYALFPEFIPVNQPVAYRPGIVLNQQYLGAITGIYYSQVYSTK